MVKKELPQLLILKRKYVQRFPNGYMVGLYYSEDLQQYISVPLQDSNIGITHESILDQLTAISESDDIQTIMFMDSTELHINKECADSIISHVTENMDIDIDIISSDKAFLEVLTKAVVDS